MIVDDCRDTYSTTMMVWNFIQSLLFGSLGEDFGTRFPLPKLHLCGVFGFHNYHN